MWPIQTFVSQGIDESTNYAAAKLDFAFPTFVIVFSALPGPTITHRDLSVIPLLARELCGDNPISSIERELDWETGNAMSTWNAKPSAFR